MLFVDFIASLWQFNERICRRHLPSHSQPHPQPLVYTYMYPCHRVKALLGTLFFLNIKYSNILHSHTRWRHANILAYISAGKWQPKCQKASGPGAEGGCRRWVLLGRPFAACSCRLTCNWGRSGAAGGAESWLDLLRKGRLFEAANSGPSLDTKVH